MTFFIAGCRASQASLSKSENSLLNPGGCFPRHCRQGDIRPGKGQRIAERMVVGVRVEEFYMGEEREARQGWFKPRVGLPDAKDSCSCAHYVRAGVALMSGGKGVQRR